MSAGVYARTDPERGTTVLDRKLHRKLDPKLVRSLAVGAILAMGVAFGAAPANAVYQPGEPPSVDPGTPVFAGSANPVPAEPAAYDPTTSTLQADLRRRRRGRRHVVLVRPHPRPAVLQQRDSSAVHPRPGAVHVHPQCPARSASPAAGPAPTAAAGTPTGSRRPPSAAEPVHDRGVRRPAHRGHRTSACSTRATTRRVFTRPGLSRRGEEVHHRQQRRGHRPDADQHRHRRRPPRTLTASSPIATTASADGTELTGTVTLRYGLTTVPRG